MEPSGRRQADRRVHPFRAILARVEPRQAKDYVREFNATLAPWRRESAVREFVHRTRKELGVAA
ncbi:hypothetical protein [Streptomyces sp. NPDC007074]|uniref:hypothetical protein n=1 Tax=Streptomyces sp. NPDC007074 TaxID=3156764 RepID=UPI003401F52B